MAKRLAVIFMVLAALFLLMGQARHEGTMVGDAIAAIFRIIQGGVPYHCEDVSADDDYACTMDPAVTTLLDGAFIKLDPNTSNTGAATLDVGSGPLPIYRLYDAQTPEDNDVVANSPALLLYCAACNSAAGAFTLSNPAASTPGVAAHAAEHETGGDDELDLADLPGSLGMAQTDFAVTANGRVSFDGTSTVTVRDLETKECFFTNPVTGHSDVCQLKWPYDFVATRIHCNTTTATSTVDIEFEERAEATPNTAGAEVIGSDLQCDTDGASVTSFDNASIAANSPMSLKIANPANAPSVLRVYVTGHPANF